MYTQLPGSHLNTAAHRDTATDLDAATIYAQQLPIALLVVFLIAAFYADGVRAQVRAFKLQRGHIGQLIVDQGAQLARMVRVDARGQEVGDPFDVLVQHRSGPEDQAIDERWTRVDSIITCFPASIADPRIRAKAILGDKPGAIQVRRYASGIVIVEPVEGGKQPTPALLAGPIQE